MQSNSLASLARTSTVIGYERREIPTEQQSYHENPLPFSWGGEAKEPSFSLPLGEIG
jgi:hypothetical protein